MGMIYASWCFATAATAVAEGIANGWIAEAPKANSTGRRRNWRTTIHVSDNKTNLKWPEDWLPPVRILTHV